METKEHFWTGKCAGLGEALQIFNAHKELVKDKLFSIKDIKKAFEEGIDDQFMTNQINDYEQRNNYREGRFDTLLNYLSPKTEWSVTLDEQGKIKLI